MRRIVKSTWMDDPTHTSNSEGKENDASYNRDTCTPMSVAALFSIAKGWDEPRCPSAEEQIKKMWYICTMEYYSAIKNKSMSFAGK
jgi:hypothetical protein